MWPCALRPPDFFIGAVSFFSGFVFVISAKSATVMWRRAGLVGLYSLRAMVSLRPRLRPLEEGDGLALLQGHERLLPVRAAADVAADALVLPARHGGADGEDVHLEQLLDGLLHLDLGRVAVHLERELPGRLAGALVLLGDERTLHHVLDGEVHESTSSSFFAVAAVSTSASCFRMSYTLSPSTGRKSEPSRLRTLFASDWFAAASTTSAFFAPSFARTFPAAAVFGACGAHSWTITSLPPWLRSASAERSAALRTFFGTS